MRRALVLLALILFAGPVAADDAPTTYVLQPDGSVKAQLAEVRGEVAKLKAEVADLRKQLAAKAPRIGTIARTGPAVLDGSPRTLPLKPGCACDGCECPDGACPAGCPVAAERPASVPSDYTYVSLPGIGWTWACPRTVAAHKAGTLNLAAPTGSCANGRCAPAYIGGNPAVLPALGGCPNGRCPASR
jgi:hypothetical protein